MILLVTASNFLAQQTFDCKIIDGDTLYQRISKKITEPTAKLPFLGYSDGDRYDYDDRSHCAYTYKRLLMLNGIAKIINSSEGGYNLYTMTNGRYYGDNLYDSAERKSVIKIFSNKSYRTILYAWALPHLKEAFSNISFLKQQWLYKDFLDAEKYIAAFDLKKERADLKQIEEVDGNSFRDEKGGFNAFIFRRISNNDVSLADLKELFVKIKKDFVPLLKSKDSFCSSVTNVIVLDSSVGAIELDTAYMLFDPITKKIFSNERYKKVKQVNYYSYTNGCCLVQNFKNKYAVFKKDKGFITPFQYDEVSTVYDNGAYVLMCKSEVGLEYLDFDGKPKKISSDNASTASYPTSCYSLQSRDSLTYEYLSKVAVTKMDTTFYTKYNDAQYFYIDKFGNEIYTDSSYKITQRFGFEARVFRNMNGYEILDNGSTWKNTWYDVPKTYQLYLRSRLNSVSQPAYEYVSNENQDYDFYWLCDSSDKIICATPIAGKAVSTELVDENGNMFYQMVFPQYSPNCEKDTVYAFDFLMFNKGIAYEYKNLFSLKEKKVISTVAKNPGNSNYYFSDFFYSVKDKKYKASYQMDTVLNIKFDEEELSRFVNQNRESLKYVDLADMANPIKAYFAVKCAIGAENNTLLKLPLYKITKKAFDYNSLGDYLMLKKGDYSTGNFIYDKKSMQLNEVVYSYPFEKLIVQLGNDSIKRKYVYKENYTPIASYFIEYKGKKQTVYNENGKQLVTVSLSKMKISPENIFVIGEDIYCMSSKRDSITIPYANTNDVSGAANTTRKILVENCELINLKSNEVVLKNIVSKVLSRPEDFYDLQTYLSGPGLTSIQKYKSYLFLEEHDGQHFVFGACNENKATFGTALYSIKDKKFAIPLDTAMSVSLGLSTGDDAYYLRSCFVFKICFVWKNGRYALFGTDGKQLTDFKYVILYRSGNRDEFIYGDEDLIDNEGNASYKKGGRLYLKDGKVVEEINQY